MYLVVRVNEGFANFTTDIQKELAIYFFEMLLLSVCEFLHPFPSIHFVVAKSCNLTILRETIIISSNLGFGY